MPARYGALVFPLILSIFMCGTVSAVSTLKGLGLTPDFPLRWAVAWGLSWLIAFPVLLIILPFVRRIVGLIVEPAAR
ncbi:Protein of unknown function [Kaistia soli DSM 19436]|uniref:DUF2798 domain-containing protein n=1 Tax=Kaistia soli DSM 19436 TaxID=1122133 RepID=A0A1M5LIQ4_9HYPH|nr:DUF2798 domain-containing protein [Kaistia soli]SHG64836.1 Protein of unknown function [Kaistia soli DSM 19436]